MIITLLTDFGTQDEYVGVIKGVMLGINPQVTLVDLSHHIPPQDISAAGYMLRSAYGYFPKGTIHLAIVDPGVGTDRDILAARWNQHLFMAPDNGLLPLVWKNQTPEAIVRVNNSALYRQPVSRTFHGRDIFAPVAANLSKGVDLEDIGRPVALAQIHNPDRAVAGLLSSGELIGEIVRVDRFGNLITNIETGLLEKLASGSPSSRLKIFVGDRCIEGLAPTYADGTPQKLLALVGGHNCLEIALSGGSAARMLGANHGTRVRVKAKA